MSLKFENNMKLILTDLQTLVLSSIFASFFVIAVYIWKPIFNPPTLQIVREDRKQLPKKYQAALDEFEMRMRIASVGFLCLIAFISIVLLADPQQRRDVSIARWFGLPLFDYDVFKVCAKVLALNSILFAGEIFQILFGMTKVGYKCDLLALKNLLIAPLFEEFIYRVCLINFCLESEALTQTQAVLITPVFFAISHLHHVIVQKNENTRIRKRDALLMALFKLMYTQVFGIYSGFVYVRTASIWPAFVLHSQCNFFGVPSFQNFFDREILLSARIAAGLLYVLGTVIFLWIFSQGFDYPEPWWNLSSDMKTVS